MPRYYNFEYNEPHGFDPDFGQVKNSVARFFIGPNGPNFLPFFVIFEVLFLSVQQLKYQCFSFRAVEPVVEPVVACIVIFNVEGIWRQFQGQGIVTS